MSASLKRAIILHLSLISAAVATIVTLLKYLKYLSGGVKANTSAYSSASGVKAHIQSMA